MDLAFASIAPLQLHGSFVGGSLCVTSRTAVHTVSRTSIPRMVGGEATIPVEPEGLPEDLSAETGDVALLDVDDGDRVSVIDIEDDTEYDFDESEIIPCSPPQPVINAQAIAATRLKFRLHENDSGSPEYQIATLTARIAYLTEHLKKNRKDYSSTRGLLKMVATRRRLLKYVKRQDPSRFDRLVKELNIRVSQDLRAV